MGYGFMDLEVENVKQIGQVTHRPYNPINNNKDSTNTPHTISDLFHSYNNNTNNNNNSNTNTNNNTNTNSNNDIIPDNISTNIQQALPTTNKDISPIADVDVPNQRSCVLHNGGVNNDDVGAVASMHSSELQSPYIPMHKVHKVTHKDQNMQVESDIDQYIEDNDGDIDISIIDELE